MNKMCIWCQIYSSVSKSDCAWAECQLGESKGEQDTQQWPLGSAPRGFFLPAPPSSPGLIVPSLPRGSSALPIENRFRDFATVLYWRGQVQQFHHDNLFIGPESDHWECFSLTNSFTDWLTAVWYTWFMWPWCVKMPTQNLLRLLPLLKCWC